MKTRIIIIFILSIYFHLPAQEKNNIRIFIKPVNIIGNHTIATNENPYNLGFDYERWMKTNNYWGTGMNFFKTNVFIGSYSEYFDLKAYDIIEEKKTSFFVNIPLFFKVVYRKNNFYNPSLKMGISNDIIFYKKNYSLRYYDLNKLSYSEELKTQGFQFFYQFVYVDMEVGNSFNIKNNQHLFIALDFRYKVWDIFTDTNYSTYTYMAGMKVGYGFLF